MRNIEPNISSIKDTTLWKKLNDDKNETAQFLSNNLIPIAEESFNRMKLMPIYFKEYTLHDTVHLLRVIELSSMILGDIIEELNPLEISFLILSCLLHDQGMIVTDEEYIAMQNNHDFLVFRDNWFLDHPNKFEIERELNSININPDEKVRLALKLSDLEKALLTDYLRIKHGARSSEYIRIHYGNDKRLEVFGINLSDYLAKLAGSHCLSVDRLLPSNNFNYDELIGPYKVNLPYLGIILRLADLLDFDNERTPDILFRSLHFTNRISLNEWNKHRSVNGWRINRNEILFSMQFEHPVYEATAKKFLDYIDFELSECHGLIRNFPKQIANYALNLPTKVNRSRIGPKDKSYIFHNLEFSISRDEIVKLLMTDKLYNRPDLCIRELLQNSLDALRYRQALFGCVGINWNDGQVNFTHELDQYGYEIITCEDNGVGMDEKIITNFLGKVGRSFYRSPEYEHLRLEFKQTGVDFDPCSQFGIGFMSCFMLGDRIKIETRKDYGYGKEYGKPLVIEINGLGGIFVIREGIDDQPIGTRITITSRKKPTFFDEWTDRVNLILVLKGYALATEFIINAHCKIKEIEDTISIPPIIDKPETEFQFYKLSDIITFEENLHKIDKRLNGYLIESFLIDENGLPTIENSQGHWIINKTGSTSKREFKLRNKNKIDNENHWEKYFYGATVSIDGIYIGGDPGRYSYKKDVGIRLGSSNSGIHPLGICLIDIRGDIKPEITPARKMPDLNFLERHPSWEYIRYLISKAECNIWNKIIEFLSNGLLPENFLKIISIHHFWLPGCSFNNIWHHLKIPFMDDKKNIEWISFIDISKLELKKVDNNFSFSCQSKSITISDELEIWEKEDDKKDFMLWSINSAVLVSSKLYFENNKYLYQPFLNQEKEIPKLFFLRDRLGITGCLIEFDSDINKAITIDEIFPVGNRNHPLTKIYLDGLFVNHKTDIQEFASSFVPCIIDLISTKEEKFGLDNPGRWAKYCAHKYFEVDWNKYSEELKAPYFVLLKEKGWYTIDESVISGWKELSIK